MTSSASLSGKKRPFPQTKSTQTQSSRLNQYFHITPTTTTSPKPLSGNDLAFRLASLNNCRARPERKHARHLPPIPQEYAAADVKVTESKMVKLVAEHRVRTGDERMLYLYAPKEWWDDLYGAPGSVHMRYYEHKYGANGTRSVGIFCRQCENTRCGWDENERYHFQNGLCPNCQKLPPEDPFAAPKRRRRLPSSALNLMETAQRLRHLRPQLRPQVKEITLHEITRLRLPVSE
jgi:hypothetical protein